MAEEMAEREEMLSRLEAEIERRLLERFAALRDEFDRLRLEADRRWAGFLERFEQDFAGIVPAEMLQPVAESAAAAGSIGIEDVRTLDAAANQVEALHRFLELCRRRASRVALLVARGGSAGVWKAVGFSEHGLDDEAVRKIAFAASDSPIAEALEGAPLSLSRGNALSARLEASDAIQAVVVPMVVKEKVSGVVYADAVPGEESKFDSDGIALLTFLAGLTVDRLASRRLRPSPALRPLPDRATRVLEDISDLGIPRPREVPLSVPSPPPSPPPASRGVETTHIDFETTGSAAARPPAPPPEAPPAAEVPAVAAPPTAGPLPPPPEPMAASPAATVRMPEVSPEAPASAGPLPRPEPTPPVAPPPLSSRRLGGPLARSEETDERRDEARRFAKLLVSEIKLYNERALQEGRERGNLYEMLKDDIDRSRQMYDERIPEDIRSSTNFFYEELVRTLADGRAEALGL